MGNITQYENPNTGLRPTEEGVSATVQSAYRGGRFFTEAASAVREVGNQAGQEFGSAIRTAGDVAVKAVEHYEIGHGAAAWAGLNEQLTNKWNEKVKTADPNDPNVANDFRTKVLEPELDKFKNNFFSEGAQKWAESRVDAMRTHFYTKTDADMGSLAADAVAVNMKRTANSLSNAAVTDPSSVPHLLDSVDQTVGPMVDSSPYLKGAVGSKAKMQLTQDTKQRIVQSGAMSAIQKSNNPEATAAEWAKKYPDYINGSEALTLAKAARTQIKFNEAQDRASRVAQRQLEKDDADKFGAGLVAQIIKPDGTFAPATPQYFQQLREAVMPGPKQLPGMTTAKAIELFKFGQTENDIKVSDPVAKAALQERLYDAAHPLDPMEIIKAANDKKISHADAGILEGQRKLIEEHPVNTPGIKTVISAAKAALVVPTNHSDFVQDFTSEYLKAKNDGSLKPGDLNFSDPNSLVSKVLAKHQPSNADKMQFKVLQSLGQGIGDVAEQTKILNAQPAPPGMSVPDMVAKFGPGAYIKDEQGNIRKLPMK